MLALGTAALVAFGIGLALHPVARSAARPTEADGVRTELAARYYRNLSQTELAQPTVSRLISGLHDRYTTYLSPAAYRLARLPQEPDLKGCRCASLSRTQKAVAPFITTTFRQQPQKPCLAGTSRLKVSHRAFSGLACAPKPPCRS